MEKILDLLELINKFSQIVGYQIHIQKSILFLCISNENLEMKLRKQFHL